MRQFTSSTDCLSSLNLFIYYRSHTAPITTFINRKFHPHSSFIIFTFSSFLALLIVLSHKIDVDEGDCRNNSTFFILFELWKNDTSHSSLPESYSRSDTPCALILIQPVLKSFFCFLFHYYRRLQPVKPLNPLGQQSVSAERDKKSSEVQEKTKVSLPFKILFKMLVNGFL